MDLGDRFCKFVSCTPEVSNATARIGAWLIGVAEQRGGFPVELTYRQIRDGIQVDDDSIPGTGSRLETIKAAVQWLEDHGVLETSIGGPSGFGHFTRKYSITL